MSRRRKQNQKVSPDCVIDLTLDEDDAVASSVSNDEPSQERQRSLSGLRELFRTTKSATEAAVSAESTVIGRTIKGESNSHNNNSSISSSSSSSINNGNTTNNSTALERRRARRRLARAGSSNTPNNNDDDVEIVAAPAKKIKLATTTNTDGDVEMVGVANEAKLPHMRQVRSGPSDFVLCILFLRRLNSFSYHLFFDTRCFSSAIFFYSSTAQHCTECRFESHTASNTITNKNKECCDLCYCYVCDIKAKDCPQWDSLHCHAEDTGPRASVWKALRKTNAQENAGGGASGTITAASTGSLTSRVARLNEQLRRLRNFGLHVPNHHNGHTSIDNTTNATIHIRGKPFKAGAGPFEPTDAVAQSDPNLTQCRHCDWYNRFFHRNFRQYRKLHPVGFLDWCQSCGRVASEKDFGKKQSKAYNKRASGGDVFLGERVIPFRLFCHDPRKMPRYADQWNKYGTTNNEEDEEANTIAAKWTYSESDMKADLFRHRFGKRPTARMVLESIPIVKPDKIPTTGAFYQRVEESKYEKEPVTHDKRRKAEIYASRCGRGNKYAYWQHAANRGGYDDAAVDETEGVLLDDPNDVALFRELAHFESHGFCHDKKSDLKVMLPYDMTAKWNHETQTGSFTLRLFVRTDRTPNFDMGTASFSKLLAVWYRMAPFALKDLGGSLQADSELTGSTYRNISVVTTIPPFQLGRGSVDKEATDFKQKASDAAKSYNDTMKDRNNDFLTLESSRKGGLFGGTSYPALGLESTLKRFFSEVLPEDIVNGNVRTGNRWVDKSIGVISHHRSMRKYGVALVSSSSSPSNHSSSARHDVSAYLHHEDVPLAVENLRSASSKLFNNTKSMKGILDHCENLGHAEIPYFEGLTVELLQFQKQAVQWCLEREKVAGGIQSLWTPKLPHVADRDKSALYYNPILETFGDRPRLVRGGIIAQEMGLG